MAVHSLDTRVGTLDAFRSIDFRIYFAGQLISISGTWMQNLAQGYLVYQLTRSEAWLGVVACAAGLPILLMSPITGVLVDRFPRRQLLVFTQVCQMLFAFLLAFLTFSQQLQVWHIVGLALLLGLTNSVDVPARWTFVSEIVGKDLLRSGIALNSILNSGSRVLGPTVAGILLVRFGPAVCFLINGFSFLAVLFSLWWMQVPYANPTSANVKALDQLKEGFAFVRQHHLIRTLLLLSGIGGAFVVPLIQLMPAYADTVLNSPDEGYAALAVAQGLGSVIAAVVLGWLAVRFGYERIIPLGIVMAALVTVALAFQTVVLWACVAGFLVGFFMILQFVAINTTLQLAVPNEFRGRVLALYTLSFTGVSPFGALGLGLIASVIGTPLALMIYGILGGVLGMIVWQTSTAERQKKKHNVLDSEND